MTGVFSSVLNTAKVVPVFKKFLKLNYSSYCPISLLSEKILEKLVCTKNCIPSSTIILSITYSLGSDNNILHLLP